MTVRAIEHVGITVPDLAQATTFFAEAFGGEPALLFRAARRPYRAVGKVFVARSILFERARP